MRLYVIRHPEPLGAKGVCYGVSDLDVADDVLAAAAASLQGLLVDKPYDLMLSSPLQRCSKLAAALDDGFKVDQRLLEIDFGQWEGLAWDEIERSALDAWMDDYVESRTPGGESFGDVLARVRELVAELQSDGRSTVALVAHAGVIRSLISLVLDIPLTSSWKFSIGFATLLTLDIGAEDWQNRFVALTEGPQFA